MTFTLYAQRIFSYNWAESVAFYKYQVGLPLRLENVEMGWAEFDLGGVRLAVERQSPKDEEAKALVGRFVGISIKVDDIDWFYQELNHRGVTFTGPPQKQPWGGYLAHFSDPDGNILTLVSEEIDEDDGIVHIISDPRETYVANHAEADVITVPALVDSEDEMDDQEGQLVDQQRALEEQRIEDEVVISGILKAQNSAKEDSRKKDSAKHSDQKRPLTKDQAEYPQSSESAEVLAGASTQLAQSLESEAQGDESDVQRAIAEKQRAMAKKNGKINSIKNKALSYALRNSSLESDDDVN